MEVPPEPLASQFVEAVVAHARFTYPEEACGLLAVDGERRVRMAYCLTNRDRSRFRFTVDPTEHYHAWRHAERHGWDIGGVFHSHPASPAFPSQTDVAGALDPDWLYVIVSLSDESNPEVRAFRIEAGAVAEVAAGGSLVG